MRRWWRPLCADQLDADSGAGAGGDRSYHRWRGGGHCRFAVGRFLTRYRRPGGNCRRAPRFVKAVSSTQNEQSPSLHRAEAQVVGQLPSTSYVPALLGVYDDGVWVGLVFEDLDGHTPAVPWNAAEVEAAMTALQHMAREFTPSPVPHLASVTSSYATVFAGWERIRVEPPTDLDPWSRHHLDDFCRL